MGVNPREAAMIALYKIEKEGAYSTKAIVDAAKDADARDRAFVNELVMGVLRNKLRIDYIIQSYSKIRLKKLSPRVWQILRCGVYQLVWMDKVPTSAACNEAVKLASKYAHNAAKGYVNGVLRSISRSLDALPEPSAKNRAEYLSVMYSCPQWLVDKLSSQFGDETCEKILKDSLLPHSPMIRVNKTKTTAEKLMEILAEEGICAQKGEEEDCLIITGAIDINSSKAYKDGYYTLQNINSMRAVLALAPKSGETVIDVCSAPGGKTTHIAEIIEDKGKVIAFDIHPHKIKLIESAAKRLCLTCIDAMVNNSEMPVDKFIGTADRVLADVPCSGIGVIHKKPDIKWNRQAEDINKLCETQKNILCSASQYLKSGGTLVYSTCTILKEENSDVIDEFLKTHNDFEKQSEKLYLAHETGGSGFYICVLKKK